MSEDKDGLRYSRPAGLSNTAVYHITDGKSIQAKLAEIKKHQGGCDRAGREGFTAWIGGQQGPREAGHHPACQAGPGQGSPCAAKP